MSDQNGMMMATTMDGLCSNSQYTRLFSYILMVEYLSLPLFLLLYHLAPNSQPATMGWLWLLAGVWKEIFAMGRPCSPSQHKYMDGWDDDGAANFRCPIIAYRFSQKKTRARLDTELKASLGDDDMSAVVDGLCWELRASSWDGGGAQRSRVVWRRGERREHLISQGEFGCEWSCSNFQNRPPFISFTTVKYFWRNFRCNIYFSRQQIDLEQTKFFIFRSLISDEKFVSEAQISKYWVRGASSQPIPPVFLFCCRIFRCVYKRDKIFQYFVELFYIAIEHELSFTM